MRNANKSWPSNRLLMAVLLPVLVAHAQVKGHNDKDTHRPACASSQCRKIKSFVKAHYCGKSPEGNGPVDGCEIVRPKRLTADIKVKADFDCDWIEGVRKCQQHGGPSAQVRSILTSELRRLGLPAKVDGQIYFTEWASSASSWSLGAADYYQSSGDNVLLCEVIAVMDQTSHVHVLRKVPFQKNDADKPTVTTWSPIDLADAAGDGHIEVILKGDAYEDHWIEVESVEGDSSHTIFSGLGYYL